MPSFVTITVDTAAPTGVAVQINGGATSSADDDVTVAVTSASPDATSVQVYGDVSDTAAPSSYRATQANAPFVALSGSPFAVKLSAGDGAKVVRVRVRDDVLNISGEATATINVDTTLPAPTVTSGPTPAKVSDKIGARTSSFVWNVPGEAVAAWELRVVPAGSSDHSAGVALGSANGSTNVSGGALAAATPITSTVDERDLVAASPGDGDKIVKVFAQEVGTGLWSAV